VVGVRRLLLSRSQHLLYYEVDHTRATIEIIALWHTARGGAPPL
jgi:hypothetical protein